MVGGSAGKKCEARHSCNVALAVQVVGVVVPALDPSEEGLGGGGRQRSHVGVGPEGRPPQMDHGG